MDHEDKKAARETQWREAPQRPIATKPMNMAEIENYRKLLVQSYRCNDKDIRPEFVKIVDHDNEDRDDCVWLKYYLKTFDHDNNIVDRPIQSLKLPVPEHIRKRAAEVRKQDRATSGRSRRRTQKTLPAPGDPVGAQANAQTTDIDQHSMHSDIHMPQNVNPQYAAPRTRPVPRGSRLAPQ